MRGQIGGLDRCRRTDINLRIGRRHGNGSEHGQPLERADDAVGDLGRKSDAYPVAKIAFLEIVLAVRHGEDGDVTPFEDGIANLDAGPHQVNVGKAQGPPGNVLDRRDFNVAIRTAAKAFGQNLGTIVNDNMASSEGHVASCHPGSEVVGVDRVAIQIQSARICIAAYGNIPPIGEQVPANAIGSVFGPGSNAHPVDAIQISLCQ